MYVLYLPCTHSANNKTYYNFTTYFFFFNSLDAQTLIHANTLINKKSSEQNISSISLDASKGNSKKIMGRTPKRGLNTVLTKNLFKGKNLFYRKSNGSSQYDKNLRVVLFN